MKVLGASCAQWSAQRLTAFPIALLLSVVPLSASAQDKVQFKAQARALLEQMRNEGEPRDRCSLGASIHDGPVVSRTDATSALKAGDRLVLMDGASLSGKSADEVIALLRSRPPEARVVMTIDRGGELIDVEVDCVNARKWSVPMESALTFASKGKFDDCVRATTELSTRDTRFAMLGAQCASLSRNAKKLGAVRLREGAMRMSIEDARHAPSLRKGVVEGLRASEGVITQELGATRYRALVDATKEWPGGERAYEQSAPDWAHFRTNAERALRGRLIDPDSARIEWPHGFTLGSWKPFLSKPIEGYWSCGRINARNRMGGYTGNTAFVVVLDPSGAVKYSSIGEADDLDLLTIACNNSAKQLPPPPPALQLDRQSEGEFSVADELKKLAELRDSGVLSEEEFSAAKRRVLERGSD